VALDDLDELLQVVTNQDELRVVPLVVQVNPAVAQFVIDECPALLRGEVAPDRLGDGDDEKRRLLVVLILAGEEGGEATDLASGPPRLLAGALLDLVGEDELDLDVREVAVVLADQLFGDLLDVRCVSVSSGQARPPCGISIAGVTR
jgi:hypothetical protein